MLEKSDALSLGEAALARWSNAFRVVDATIPRCTPTSQNAYHTRERLNAEIAGIHAVLAAANERLNDLALPSILPPEVLAHVFSFLVQLDPVYVVPEYYGAPKALGWLRVSHVSRRWRHVCLDQPSLWTRLRPDESQPWDVFLQRAKDASLRISGYQFKPHRDGTTCVPHIIAHQHNIQELSLCGIDALYLNELTNGLVGPLPRLQILSLSCPTETDGPLPALHPKFFSGTAPNLQELSLSGVGFPWGEGSPNITMFSYEQRALLSDIQALYIAHEYGQVIHTLRQMPALKSLTLKNALPDASTESYSEHITFPRLERLHIADDNNSCWRLWSQLSIPSSACISFLRTRSESTTPSPESLIASTLHKHLSLPAAPSVSAMTVQMAHLPGEELLYFYLSCDGTSDASTGSTSTPGRIRPSIILQLRGHEEASLARRLVEAVPLHNLLELEIRGSPLGEAHTLYNLFLPARSVTDLRLAGDNAGPALVALISGSLPLSSTTSNTAPAPRDQGLFPKLAYMRCSSVDFDAEVHCSGMNIPIHTVLDSVLAKRSFKVGASLEFLNIALCHASKEWVKGWQKLIDELEWDEYEGNLLRQDHLNLLNALGWDGDGYDEVHPLDDVGFDTL